MITRTIAVTCCVLLAASPVPAQQTGTAITPADLRTRLYALAHDSMGGRATGSIGNYNAAEWIAGEFKRLGLQPAGENGSFFQTIPFLRFGPDPSATLSLDGSPLAMGREILPLPWQGQSPPMDGARVIYGGMITDTAGRLAPEAVRGKIVLFGTPDIPLRRIGALIGPLRRDPRYQEAALVILPMLDAAGPEVIAAVLDGGVVTDTTRVAPRTPMALVTSAVAERLLGRPLEGAASGTPGRTVKGQLRSGFTPLPYPARNVVAVLPGSDPALRSTYVSITAHNDHVGFDHMPVDHDSLRAFNEVVRPMGADSPNREPTAEEWAQIRHILDSLRALRPARPDSIRNGADDDGTGTVALLEIAEKFAAGPRPRRSILFVSHAAEEEGLLGSAWFTDHPTVPVDSIVAEMDMDMIGRGNRADLPAGGPGYLEVIGYGRLSREYGEILDTVNARQPMPFTFDLTYNQPGHPLQYYCRADHYSYARYGIPAIAVSRGEHLDYHQVTDEAQYIDYDALQRVAAMIGDLALEVANLDHRPKLDQPKGDPHARCVQ